MSNTQLETVIEAAWDARDSITPATTGEVREAIEDTLNALDSGALRVAEKQPDGRWHVNQWAKKAVLLGFRLQDMEAMSGGPQGSDWWDKVDSKFKGWGDAQWNKAGFRAVPGAIARKSAYIARRGADAVFCQSGGLCGRRHHGGYLGFGGLLCADRQKRASVRRGWHWRCVRADAGRADHH